MRLLLRLLTLMVVLSLTACAVPVAIKQLSVAQMGYFDTAVQAVRLQSEVLLVAAERIKSDAEKRIEKRAEETRARNEKLAIEVVPTLPEAKRKDTVKRILDDAEKTNRTVAEANAKLNQDFEAIKSKTQELETYIIKMKEVHAALDAYLQSQQAGEQVLQSVLKQPTVEGLIGSVSSLSTQVTSTIGDIQGLISGLATGG